MELSRRFSPKRTNKLYIKIHVSKRNENRDILNSEWLGQNLKAFLNRIFNNSLWKFSTSTQDRCLTIWKQLSLAFDQLFFNIKQELELCLSKWNEDKLEAKINLTCSYFAVQIFFKRSRIFCLFLQQFKISSDERKKTLIKHNDSLQVVVDRLKFSWSVKKTCFSHRKTRRLDRDKQLSKFSFKFFVLFVSSTWCHPSVYSRKKQVLTSEKVSQLPVCWFSSRLVLWVFQRILLQLLTQAKRMKLLQSKLKTNLFVCLDQMLQLRLLTMVPSPRSANTFFISSSFEIVYSDQILTQIR